MKFETTRFGEVEIREEDIITFPRGLIGFPDIKRYAVVDHPGEGPFKWLQAIDDPQRAFVITDPLLFFPEYTVAVKPEDLDSIRIRNVADGIVVVILVVPGDPWRITANLQGPVVINTKECLGMQLVLNQPEYTTKHLLFTKEEAAEATKETSRQEA